MMITSKLSPMAGDCIIQYYDNAGNLTYECLRQEYVHAPKKADCAVDTITFTIYGKDDNRDIYSYSRSTNPQDGCVIIHRRHIDDGSISKEYDMRISLDSWRQRYLYASQDLVLTILRICRQSLPSLTDILSKRE